MSGVEVGAIFTSILGAAAGAAVSSLFGKKAPDGPKSPTAPTPDDKTRLRNQQRMAQARAEEQGRASTIMSGDSNKLG